MSPLHRGLSFGLLLIAGAAAFAPVDARDQGLQAILQKSGCVASKVVPTDLSPLVTSYEVTCRGRPAVLYILCKERVCQLQPKPREDEEER